MPSACTSCWEKMRSHDRSREGARRARDSSGAMMRRAAWSAILPLFLGCAGRNVVAGDEKTTSQELAAAVPSWCRETCDFLAVCSMKRGCDCAAGDSCDCAVVPKDCEANCQKELSSYAVGDDVCAQAGQRIMGCIDRLTCDDINQARGSLCEP